jgi:hypothetical protein
MFNGAAADISTVTWTAADAAPVLRDESVTVAVKLWVPSANRSVVKCQDP